MSHWLEERRREDQRHSERNRKAEDYGRLAAEVERLRMTSEDVEAVLAAARDAASSGWVRRERVLLTLINRHTTSRSDTKEEGERVVPLYRSTTLTEEERAGVGDD